MRKRTQYTLLGTVLTLILLYGITSHDRQSIFMTQHSYFLSYAGVSQQLSYQLSSLERSASVEPVHRTIVTSSVSADTIEKAVEKQEQEEQEEQVRQREERRKQQLRNRPSNVPNGQAGCHSDCFSHMGYRSITDTCSDQYALQKKATTDKETGVRMVDGCYLVAVGSYYADHVGQKLDVVMESGDIITVMVGDFKSDEHTDSSHRFHTGDAQYPGDGSVLELIVDTSCYTTDRRPEVFHGKIKSIYPQKKHEIRMDKSTK